MKLFTMTDRRFSPLATDESPKRGSKGIGDRDRFSSGTEFEPGHQQRVRVMVEGDGWMPAVYDRVCCRFMALFRSQGSNWWYDVAPDRVRSWTQKPPGDNFADPAVA